jgi:hypothetical protein
MMDIRARHLLGEIRKHAPNAVIAGGAARDDYFDVEPKDYDIFVSSDSWREVRKHFSVMGIVASPKKDEYYGGLDSPVTKVYDVSYEGLDVDIVTMIFDEDEDFGNKVVQDFDYGICRIYFDGSSILRDTEEFQMDVRDETFTLLKLPGLDYLPHAMQRYEKIKLRLGRDYSFRCPLLQVIGQENSSEVVAARTGRSREKLRPLPLVPQAAQPAQEDMDAWLRENLNGIPQPAQADIDRWGDAANIAARQERRRLNVAGEPVEAVAFNWHDAI